MDKLSNKLEEVPKGFEKRTPTLDSIVSAVELEDTTPKNLEYVASLVLRQPDFTPKFFEFLETAALLRFARFPDRKELDIPLATLLTQILDEDGFLDIKHLVHLYNTKDRDFISLLTILIEELSEIVPILASEILIQEHLRMAAFGQHIIDLYEVGDLTAVGTIINDAGPETVLTPDRLIVGLLEIQNGYLKTMLDTFISDDTPVHLTPNINPKTLKKAQLSLLNVRNSLLDLGDCLHTVPIVASAITAVMEIMPADDQDPWKVDRFLDNLQALRSGPDVYNLLSSGQILNATVVPSIFDAITIDVLQQNIGKLEKGDFNKHIRILRALGLETDQTEIITAIAKATAIAAIQEQIQNKIPLTGGKN